MADDVGIDISDVNVSVSLDDDTVRATETPGYEVTVEMPTGLTAPHRERLEETADAILTETCRQKNNWLSVRDDYPDEKAGYRA